MNSPKLNFAFTEFYEVRPGLEFSEGARIARGYTGAVPYDPTIYLGSAAHYRHGRPAYSPELEALLTQKTGLDGTGRLLDAGCGPGVLTIRLAHLFERAVGLDPDARMLAEGCRAAEEKGVTNIRWVQGLAEDLPAVAPGSYKLVTFGQSFHWTDEQQVAEIVYDMLEPGGALALIAHTVTGRPRPPDPGLPPIPHDDLKALVAKYLGSTRRAGQGTAQERTHRFEDVLARTRFGVPSNSSFPAFPICCEIARASCQVICPSHPRRRTCSVIVSATSPARCARCSRAALLTASSGTGRATPRSCWPASLVEWEAVAQPYLFIQVRRRGILRSWQRKL
jgi:SAM-dependent methyltransferase